MTRLAKRLASFPERLDEISCAAVLATAAPGTLLARRLGRLALRIAAFHPDGTQPDHADYQIRVEILAAEGRARSEEDCTELAEGTLSDALRPLGIVTADAHCHLFRRSATPDPGDLPATILVIDGVLINGLRPARISRHRRIALLGDAQIEFLDLP